MEHSEKCNLMEQLFLDFPLAHNKPMKRYTNFLHQELYSQHFILFVFYEWAQSARVLHYTKMQSTANDKHSSLSGLFISYKENEVF
jgi:hypothetical protein